MASEHLGIGGSLSLAEESMVSRDCTLALHLGAHTVIQHISSGNSVAFVRNTKALGANVDVRVVDHSSDGLFLLERV